MEDYNITALDYIEMINSNNLVLVADCYEYDMVPKWADNRSKEKTKNLRQ